LRPDIQRDWVRLVRWESAQYTSAWRVERGHRAAGRHCEALK
jgi:heme-degrading monooxygenase HmoA